MTKQTVQKQTIRKQDIFSDDFLHDGRTSYERELDFVEYEQDVIRGYRERIATWNY